MKILCHRGYWKTAAEKNTVTAFKRGFDLGLGTETDIRDLNGKLVISHDPPTAGAMLFADFLQMAPREVLLALNVKADGIADMAVEELRRAGHGNYVFFDMSVPDMRGYLNKGLPTALRLSEYEGWSDDLAARCDYIWLDAFKDNWYDLAKLRELLAAGKEVLVVSSELHGRDPMEQWAMLDEVAGHDRLILCTDLPEQALARFCK